MNGHEDADRFQEAVNYLIQNTNVGPRELDNVTKQIEHLSILKDREDLERYRRVIRLKLLELGVIV